jgi:hypothetical protein
VVVLIWQVLSLRIIDEDSESSLRDGSGTLEVTNKVPLRLAGVPARSFRYQDMDRSVCSINQGHLFS